MKHFASIARRASPSLAAFAAAAMLVVSPLANAQPAGHMGGGADLFSHAITQAKDKLALTPDQQTAWDSAVAHMRAARQNGHTGMQQLHSAMTAELAKPEPNLAAVAALADDVEQQNRAARKQVRDEWLALYATFSPTQKGVVRDVLAQRLARMGAMHERMQQHFHGQGATN